jgi:hypothetical protein
VRRREVSADLAVQGKSESFVCERCFATVKAPAEFCPECGAPVGTGPTEGSDAAIYPELARANLLRMRGDIKAAQDHCRNILRTFPNNVTANQLMGDLAQDANDLSQAKEWYELALDIAPNHPQISNKLDDVRQKLERKETKTLVDQIGLPPSKPKNGWMAAGIGLLVIVVGAIAYIVGTQKPKSELAGPATTSIQAPTSVPGASGDSEPGNPSGEDPATPTPSVATSSTEESSLAQLIAQRSANGSKLVGVLQDARTAHVFITYRVDASEDQRAIGAEMAATTFDNSAATQAITLRAITDGAVVFIADAKRDVYEQTKSDDWKKQNAADPTALARHILTDEWPANAAPNPGDPPSGAPPTSP